MHICPLYTKDIMNFKKIILLSIVSTYIVGLTTLAQFEVPGNPTIYTTEQEQAITADGISNPIRDGAFFVVNSGDSWVWGIVSSDTQIQTHDTAKLQTLNIVKNIINYALGLVSLVALVYLIFHGILVLTAAGDEAQYKKWLKGIQFAAIALWWIGLSRLIVSFIFYIIDWMIGWF